MKEAEAKFGLPTSKLLLIENHQYDWLRWAPATYGIDWNEIIFSDETTGYESAETARLVFTQKGKIGSDSEESGKDDCGAAFRAVEFVVFIAFEKISTLICSAKFTGTVRNQFKRKSNEWTLQEDDNLKHMSKLANEWRLEHEFSSPQCLQT